MTAAARPVLHRHWRSSGVEFAEQIGSVLIQSHGIS